MKSDPGAESLGIVAQTQVGDLVTVTTSWVGPGVGSLTDIHWGIEGATTDPKTATAIEGYDTTKATNQITCLTAVDLQDIIVSFYYLPTALTREPRHTDIYLDAAYGGESYHCQTIILVWTPIFNPDPAATDFTAPNVGNLDTANGQMLTPTNGNGLSGVGFGAVMKTNGPFSTGVWHYTQLLNANETVKQPDGTAHTDTDNTNRSFGLDKSYIYPVEHLGRDGVTIATAIAADGSKDLWLQDGPQYGWTWAQKLIFVDYDFNAESYAMYNPGTLNSIDVAIAERGWSFNIVVTSPNGQQGSYSVRINPQTQQPELSPPKLTKWSFQPQPQWTKVLAGGNNNTYAPPLK